MAARNRPRAAPVKEDPTDAHEERNMWNQIVTDIKKLKQINAKAAEISAQIVEIESKLGLSPSVPQIEELTSLYREGIRNAEEEQKILNEEPNDIIKNVGILQALRMASETEPPRNTQPKNPRNPKRQKLETDGAAESPGLSPSAPANASRTKGSSSSVRSGSVPAAREAKEPSVKLEEGSEGIKGPAGERAGKFFVGAEVAYKQAKVKEDGSQWIQCNIKSITEVGNKKRYEVQDPEPDESGAPGQVYKTSAAALIAIPLPDAALPDYPVGKQVLARYPETTTFYRADVTGLKKDTYKLRFEDDQNQEMEVYRRYVLDFSNK